MLWSTKSVTKPEYESPKKLCKTALLQSYISFQSFPIISKEQLPGTYETHYNTVNVCTFVTGVYCIIKNNNKIVMFVKALCEVNEGVCVCFKDGTDFFA